MDRITVSDRRRINGPSGGTSPPVFSSILGSPEALQAQRPVRTRKANELRKICMLGIILQLPCHIANRRRSADLKTGLIPSASGSAYYELETPASSIKTNSLCPPSSALKISCAVHGPKPLPRSAPFSPNLVLSTHVKFAPFAARQRRGYIRDSGERDLGVHLESALRGVVIGERWPKSGVDVIITILEGEEDRWWGDEMWGSSAGIGVGAGWGLMGVLAGCITAACAAMTDAGIDCVDLICGGVAAIVKNPAWKESGKGKQTDGGSDEEHGETLVVLDPSPSEHSDIISACVVGYLQSRDEITELWMKGDAGLSAGDLVDKAVQAAISSRLLLEQSVRESTELKFRIKNETSDVEMS